MTPRRIKVSMSSRNALSTVGRPPLRPLCGCSRRLPAGGQPPGDVAALAQAIVALSRLAITDPAVLEAEVNPLIVTENGAIAVDALVRLA
jgi:hypothetical protein